MLEDVASFLECLLYYSHTMFRFLMARTSRTIVVDSFVGCNKKNIINNNNDNNSNYNNNLNHMIERYLDEIRDTKNIQVL